RDCRAADKCDEFPPPHGADPKAKDHGRSIADLVWGGGVHRGKQHAPDGHPTFAERDVMECGLTKPASLRLDVEGPDHLAPLVGLFADELTEVGGRACKQYAAHFSQPRLDLRVSKARVDCIVEFLDEFGRRVLGCTETQPRAGLVTCYELANRRNIRQSLQ